MEGFFTFGMNPVGNGPHSREDGRRAREAEVAGRRRELRDGDGRLLEGPRSSSSSISKPEDVQTEVFLLPAANFAEKDGSVRQLRALDPVEMEGARSAGRREGRPGDRRAHLPEGARPLREGRRALPGAGPEPELVVHQPGAARRSPRSARRSTAGRSQDVRDPAGNVVTMRAGQQLGAVPRCARRRLDAVRQLALHRDVHRGRQPDAAPIPDADPSGLGLYPGLGGQLAGQPPHPLQPLLGRRGRDGRGIRRASASRGTASAGSATSPDYTADMRRTRDSARSSCFPKAWRGCSCRGQFVDGPWPEHYEPVESPVANPLHPEHSSNPACEAFTTENDVLGKAESFRSSARPTG